MLQCSQTLRGSVQFSSNALDGHVWHCSQLKKNGGPRFNFRAVLNNVSKTCSGVNSETWVTNFFQTADFISHNSAFSLFISFWSLFRSLMKGLRGYVVEMQLHWNSFLKLTCIFNSFNWILLQLYCMLLFCVCVCLHPCKTSAGNANTHSVMLWIWKWIQRYPANTTPWSRQISHAGGSWVDRPLHLLHSSGHICVCHV